MQGRCEEKMESKQITHRRADMAEVVLVHGMAAMSVSAVPYISIDDDETS